MEIEIEDSGVAVHGTESDLDLDLQAQAEYSRMKRQYFLMQRHRQHVIEKAGGGTSGRRGGKLVQLLEIQRDNLESDLAAATSSTNVRKDEQIKSRIWNLLNLYEKYKAQVEQLQTEIRSMEKTVGKMTTKFYKAKLKIQAVLGVASSVGKLEKNIDNQETKLHVVKSQYDTLMTQNKELKDEIAVKINRRFAIFNRMTRLHNRMVEVRRNLNSSVDEALAVYNTWEDAQRKISFVKEKYKEEVRQHLLEMKEYDRLLFHDLREIRFYSTKNKPRSLLEESSQREARKAETEITNLQRECRKYREQFLRLEEFDPKQNVDNIITNYKSLEQKNFGYFQQISDFNKEGLALMEEIHQLKEELDILATQKEERETSNEQELLRLEVSRDNERDKLAHLKAQLEVTDESTKRIVDAVEAFFTTAECDMESLRELLGHNEHISIKNLREAFNMLEHHIATMQLEKELLNIQKEVETHTTMVPFKPPKIHRPTGGPFEPQLFISGRPELGMEKKDDEEDILFAAAPIPKAVQREHLVAQLRELGVISSPKVTIASESTSAQAVRSTTENPEEKNDKTASQAGETDEMTENSVDSATEPGEEEEEEGATTDGEQVLSEPENEKSLPVDSEQETTSQQAVQVPSDGADVPLENVEETASATSGSGDEPIDAAEEEPQNTEEAQVQPEGDEEEDEDEEDTEE